MFELIALIAEALFSWPILPTDWSDGDRRLVNLAYCGLIGRSSSWALSDWLDRTGGTSLVF